MSIEMWGDIVVLYLLLGGITGFLSGLFGIGGGVIVVPALLWVFDWRAVLPVAERMHFAVGTSLAFMLITALAAIRAHMRRGAIAWDIYTSMVMGIIPGVLCGAMLVPYLPTDILRVIFGCFLICVSITILWPNTAKTGDFPVTWLHRLVSMLIGLASGILGIGGGTLIIPYLNVCGVNLRYIPAISSLCTLTMAILGSVIFLFAHPPQMSAHASALSVGYVFLPAVVCMSLASFWTVGFGAKLGYVIPVIWLRRLLAILLALTAIDLIFV